MKEKTIKPFGIKDKIGYMFGDFGNDFTFLLSSSFLLKFYTDVMAVDAYVVGIVMMVARISRCFYRCWHGQNMRQKQRKQTRQI